jgi:TDG/mug DNA glycosylase family protein
LGPPRNVSFTRAELKSFTGATLPDLIAEGVRLLFVGINPGLRSVAVQGHFAPRGNRFYPALLRAGITDHLIDASAGLAPADRDYLLRRGVGITSLVERATASADELGPAELADGARALGAKIARYRPRVVAILGVTAYRAAFAAPRAVLGRQPEDLHGSQLWVVPNPSGRNAHAPLEPLAAAYRAVAHRRCRDLVRVATADASGSAAMACGGRNGGRGRLGSRTPASSGPPRRRMNGTCCQTQASHRLRPICSG